MADFRTWRRGIGATLTDDRFDVQEVVTISDLPSNDPHSAIAAARIEYPVNQEHSDDAYLTADGLRPRVFGYRFVEMLNASTAARVAILYRITRSQFGSLNNRRRFRGRDSFDESFRIPVYPQIASDGAGNRIFYTGKEYGFKHDRIVAERFEEQLLAASEEDDVREAIRLYHGRVFEFEDGDVLLRLKTVDVRSASGNYIVATYVFQGRGPVIGFNFIDDVVDGSPTAMRVPALAWNDEYGDPSPVVGSEDVPKILSETLYGEAVTSLEVLPGSWS